MREKLEREEASLSSVERAAVLRFVGEEKEGEEEEEGRLCSAALHDVPLFSPSRCFRRDFTRLGV